MIILNYKLKNPSRLLIQFVHISDVFDLSTNNTQRPGFGEQNIGPRGDSW